MENTLAQLFDFQKFQGNADLQRVIDSVHARYSSARRELDLDDVEFVAAAGLPYAPEKEKDEEKK